jgi:hypothetical protein
MWEKKEIRGEERERIVEYCPLFPLTADTIIGYQPLIIA